MLERARSLDWRPELLVLTALSIVTRFWHLFTPRAVVWDETHYEHFAGHYLSHTFFVDVHPPLSGLLYAGVAHLFSISSSTLEAAQPAVLLRVLPAALGAALVPLAYVLVRQLGGSRRVATLAGLAILCDNAFLVYSRLILPEMLIIGFGMMALVLFLAARNRDGALRWTLLAAAALAAGGAVSVKWTGLSPVGLMLIVLAYDAFVARSRLTRRVVEAAVVVAIVSGVYVASFAVHFHALRNAGPNDFRVPTRLRTTIVGDSAYDPAARVSLLEKIADQHWAMNNGNNVLRYATHEGASRWYTWPIMKHPIGLWASPSSPTTMIVLVGNPALWWGSCAMFVIALAAFLRNKTVFARVGFGVAFLAGAWLANVLPFVPVQRLLYLYHYLFALVFGIAFSSMALGALAGWNDEGPPWHFRSTRSRTLYWAVAAVIVVAFLYFLPLTYGLPLDQSGFDMRFRVLHPL